MNNSHVVDKEVEKTTALYWSKSTAVLLRVKQGSPKGLTDEEAQKWLNKFGPNLIVILQEISPSKLSLRQLKSFYHRMAVHHFI